MIIIFLYIYIDASERITDVILIEIISHFPELI